MSDRMRWASRNARVLAVLALMMASAGTSAQVQRSFVNLGFEQPVMGANCSARVPVSTVPGWQTTHPSRTGAGCGGLPTATGPLVELWSTAYEGVSARAGSQFAELNAQDPSRLYQNVCLVNGERVSWRFSHTGRLNPLGPSDVAEFNVNSTANTIFIARTRSTGASTSTAADCVANEGGVSAGTCNASVQSGVWRDYSGQFTWNGGSGVQNFGLAAISSAGGSGVGNLLDNVTITLKPFVEFAVANLSVPEGNASLIQVRVVGEVTAAIVVPIVVSGGTATTTTDFTVGNVTIPVGDYGAGDVVTVPFTVADDRIIEDNETVTLSISPSNASSAYVVASTTTCGGSPIASMAITIVDDDVDLRTTKTASTATPTPGVPFTFTVTFNNNTARPTVAPLTAHDARVSFTDVVPAGLTFTGWTCTAGGSATCPAASGSGAINAGNVVLPAGTGGGTGSTLTYTVTATASASPSCTSVTNTSTIAPLIGYQEGTSLQPGFTSPAPGGTATNTASATITPCTTTLRLQKALPSGRALAGDQFSLSMSGTGAPAAIVTTGTGSTVSSAALTHTAAVAGSSYTLSEAASGTTVLANYTSTYSCTNARAGGQTPGGSGTSFSITPVAGDDLSCTFTNVARLADVLIQKSATPNPALANGLVQFTVTVTNNGPTAVSGATVNDPVVAGLDCTAAGLPSPTCSATSGAACPSPLTAAGLHTGVAIPALPSTGVVTFGLTCRVTATGF